MRFELCENVATKCRFFSNVYLAINFRLLQLASLPAIVIRTWPKLFRKEIIGRGLKSS